MHFQTEKTKCRIQCYSAHCSLYVIFFLINIPIVNIIFHCTLSVYLYIPSDLKKMQPRKKLLVEAKVSESPTIVLMHFLLVVRWTEQIYTILTSVQ